MVRLSACRLNFNLVISSVGVLLGLSAFVAFLFVYHNNHAAIWGLASAVGAGVCFHLHLLYKLEKLNLWHSYDGIGSLTALGTVSFIIACAALTWYIFHGVYNRESVFPIETSSYIASVWAFMTAKWSLMLRINSITYLRTFEEPLGM